MHCLRAAGMASCLVLTLIHPAEAQSGPLTAARCGGDTPSLTRVFTDTARSVARLPSQETAQLLSLGGLAALGAQPFDRRVSAALEPEGPMHAALAPGAVVGSAAVQYGAPLLAYALGRALNRPCAVAVGADLLRAQLLAHGLTVGLKAATQRQRPEGGGLSFPSGHTSATFASATVLQQHFGWKVGVPAYAVATYVAASRVQMRRHYLSDVAFGAALGIVAGRTIAVGRHHDLLVSPATVPDGMGVTFTLHRRP
ncbi:MAG: phosphatase PAP2 family protein [Vicinamibacterales bacterium]